MYGIYRIRRDAIFEDVSEKPARAGMNTSHVESVVAGKTAEGRRTAEAARLGGVFPSPRPAPRVIIAEIDPYGIRCATPAARPAVNPG